MNLIALFASGTLVVAGCTSTASAQQTGRDALAVVAREKGSAAAGQIVSLAGSRGAEQPAEWRLVARDAAFAGRFREYVVKGGRVAAAMAVPADESVQFASAPLVRNKVKIDSPVVFWRAHTEAKKALVGFDTVDYELRNAEFSNTPVWVVRLINKSGTKVGEVAVSAESGNVLRRTWFEEGRQTAARGTVSQPRQGSSTASLEQKTQQAWDGTRTGWNQGKKAVKTGLSKASTTVGGWLLRAGGADQSPPPTKPPTSGPATWQNGTYDSGARR